MPQGIIRAAIVGASSLLGKELAERLNESAGAQWDLKLLDKEEAAGQMTTAGDEAAVIQALAPEEFTAQDIVFFAGDEETARAYRADAAKAGAGIVDLTGALEGEEDISVRCPVLLSAEPAHKLDLSSLGAVSAHPAAIMLAAVIGRLHKAFAPMQASVTLLQPASQQGDAGMDEMHQQTVSLLSFKPLPQEVFDTQVAFNLSAELGVAAKTDLNTTAKKIRRHLELVAGNAVARATAMQLVQAPVFNGYTASIFIATATAIKAEDVRRAVTGDLVLAPEADDPVPSNQSAAQQDQVLVQVKAVSAGASEPQGVWLWIAVDNLRLSARNAIACAAELLALRPGARVQ